MIDSESGDIYGMYIFGQTLCWEVLKIGNMGK